MKYLNFFKKKLTGFLKTLLFAPMYALIDLYLTPDLLNHRLRELQIYSTSLSGIGCKDNLSNLARDVIELLLYHVREELLT
jgi:hypothetical protein